MYPAQHVLCLEHSVSASHCVVGDNDVVSVCGNGDDVGVVSFVFVSKNYDVDDGKAAVAVVADDVVVVVVVDDDDDDENDDENEGLFGSTQYPPRVSTSHSVRPLPQHL